MDSNDITNAKLGKLLSIEFIGSVIVGAFMAGGAYFALSTQTTALASDQKETNEQVELIKEDVNAIKRDMAVMSNDQKHIRNEMKEQKQDIKRVLHILERNGVKHNH